MNSLEIQSIINAKEKRQFILEERQNNILAIDEIIDESSFNKSFKGVYYFLKRLILLVLGGTFLLLGLLFYFSPDSFLNNELKNDIKKEIVQDYFDENEQDINFILTEAIKEIRRSQDYSAEQFKE